MDQLMEILTEVNADVDFETCDTLIDDGILILLILYLLLVN